MSPLELLENLDRRGIHLRIHDDKLRCTASDGALTPELRAELTQHRDVILTLLSDASGSDAAPNLAGVNLADAARLFELQVDRAPDATALWFENQHLSYAQLNERANQLAHFLRGQGVGLEQRVGICINRSPEMIVAVLGVLKSGAAYVPIDPLYPRRRISFMLRDAGVCLVLSQQALVERLPSDGSPIVCLDTDWYQVETCSTANTIVRRHADNLAYVIYTSGSTGRPKGTLLTHRGVCNLAIAVQEVLPLRTGTRVLQYAPLSYDASVWDIVISLFCGGTLCLVPGEKLLPAELAGILRRLMMTTVTMPPSVLAAVPFVDLPDLHTLIMAGERCPQELAKRWSAGRRVYNAYGPTEASVCTTVQQCDGAASEDPSIGQSLANTQVYVLDTRLKLVPRRVNGELCIGGMGIARGYLGRPDLTAERFVPNGFSGNPGTRLYRTGDRSRWSSDGRLYMTGRIDHQVKIHGHRIELGEVETALREHASVDEAVVTCRQDDAHSSRQQLVAFLVPSAPELPISKLRQDLSKRLPGYMLPTHFVILDSLPLTSSGKLDRGALPAPDQSEPRGDRVVQPRNRVELELARVWSIVLQVDQIGIHDNFFELGGDSILMIEALAKAKQSGIELTPRNAFEFQTISELAAAAGGSVACEQGIVQGPIPQTPIQRWLWEQDFPDSHHFNQSILFEIDIRLNFSILKSAVGHLLAHHDVLRLRCERTRNQQQITGLVPEGAAISCIQLDLSSLSESAQPGAVELAAKQLQTSLDLSSGPIIRVAYFDLGIDRPCRLLIIIHHVAIDPVSWKILLEDFTAAYLRQVHGHPVELPAKTTSFKRWAERLHEYSRSQQLLQELDFWCSAIDGRADRLPADDPEVDGTVAFGESLSVNLEPEESRLLRRVIPRLHQAQVSEVILTAILDAFVRWTGNTSLLIDVETHGRELLFEDIDTSRTVGWFTSIFPVRLETDTAASLAESLRQVQAQLGRIPNRGVGYGLLRYLGDDRVREQLAELPQAEVNFNYLGQTGSKSIESSMLRLANESSGPMISERVRWPYAITIVAVVSDDQLAVQWSYNGRRYRNQTIQQLADNFLDALRDLIVQLTAST